MKKKYIFYLIFVNLIFFSASSKTLAATQTMNLNVPIGNITGGEVNTQLLGNYLAAWYNFLLGSVGIIATIVIMWGGFKWLSSRGDTKQISDAQDIIFSAIAGLILAFGSFLIISLVNPNLTKINMPELEKIDWNNFKFTDKGDIYNNLSQKTTNPESRQNWILLPNKKVPKVPCPNVNGYKDYGMAYIASHEGYQSTPYPDDLDPNKENIYYGHQLQDNEKYNGTEKQAIEWLKADYQKAIENARNAANNHGVNFDNLSAGRQIVLVDMAYNIGGASLNKFDNMWSAIKENNFEQAGNEILNSKYYEQLKETGRPQLNADIMAADPDTGDQKILDEASFYCQDENYVNVIQYDGSY